MSEPKRFNFSATIVHHIVGEKTAALKYHSEPDGLFVSYEDYARLKAENERLTPLLGDIVAFDEYHKLLQQVERLTKAGDAMVDMVDWEVPYERRKKLESDWNAAKEGKPRA